MENTTRRDLHRALSVQLCFAAVTLVYAVVAHANVRRWRKHAQFTQFFTERDPSLSYPLLASTVPSWLLAVTSTLVPAVAVLGANLMRWRRQSGRASANGGGDASTTSSAACARHTNSDVSTPNSALCTSGCECAIPRAGTRGSRARSAALYVCAFELLGMGQAMLITMGTYNSVKSFVGRLRPNFFAACDFKGYRAALVSGDFTAYLAATVPGAVGDPTHCEASMKETLEASLSFPSGHAALAFAGMTYAALTLTAAAAAAASATVVASGSGAEMGGSQKQPRGVSPWLAGSCLPMAYAVYVSCTRITDYKHRPADVLVGAAIGVAAALACRPGGLGAWWLAQVAGDASFGGNNVGSGDMSGDGGGVGGGGGGGGSTIRGNQGSHDGGGGGSADEMALITTAAAL